MKRRKSSLDSADFAPLVEVPLPADIGPMTLPTLQRQFEVLAQKVNAAAPALACLECLEVELSLEWNGKVHVLAFWLRTKKQVALWVGGPQTPSELDALIRRDLKTLSTSIREAQLQLDKLADKLRKQKALAAEERDARRFCGPLLDYLTRDEDRIAGILRRHGGSCLDFLVPGQGDTRFAFPLFAGGEVRRPKSERLLARARNFTRGVVRIYHICALVEGEWRPLAGIDRGDIELTWTADEYFDELAPIIEAVRTGGFAEFTAILFEDASTGVPRRAELTGCSEVESVRTPSTGTQSEAGLLEAQWMTDRQRIPEEDNQPQHFFTHNGSRRNQ